MVVCCLVRTIEHLRGGERRVLSNGGMIISRGKPKTFERISYEIALRNEPKAKPFEDRA
jgi:hypothetical protein